ncbi:hypothetical protein HGI30_22785 [Paenibacillus albicereus]|uniref:Uncharacterized protein n=1 Tax=Paenibacillus albicereus TaxID=2726185 RepID=A0A6H2H397_9BACL|nr:hypothetical protein [Paenibacillus albicereus]QJC54069.1 hypothetical protein HGI30_22785 [Paenibacillus albicereus]
MNEEDMQRVVEELSKSASADQTTAGKLQMMDMSLTSIAYSLEEANRNMEILLYLLGAMTVLLAIGLGFFIFKKIKS